MYTETRENLSLKYQSSMPDKKQEAEFENYS